MRLITYLLLPLLLASHSVSAQEMSDGTYDCTGGLTTGIKALDRLWTPIGKDTQNYQVTLSNNLQMAQINGMEYDCKLRFFEFLGCSTGFYHFAVNINSGRFTFDQSYGFIRGETPGGDAEEVTTTLGYCQAAPKS